MEYVIDQNVHDTELNEKLRMEPAWKDVSSGLGWILAGYLTFLIGTGVGVGLVLSAANGWLIGEGARPGRLPTLSVMWQFYIGLGILSVVGTIGYLIILGGQWRCMHGASERHGARWLMFFCLVSLFAGPALNVASYMGCCQRAPDLKRGPSSLQQMQFTQTGRYMQIGGAAASLLYSLMFLLFLRAVAKCHGSRAHVTLVNFYLGFVALLVGLTVYVGYQTWKDALPQDTSPWLWIVGGWGLCFIFYLFLIGSIRSCVLESLARVRSPLDV